MPNTVIGLQSKVRTYAISDYKAGRMEVRAWGFPLLTRIRVSQSPEHGAGSPAVTQLTR